MESFQLNHIEHFLFIFPLYFFGRLPEPTPPMVEPYSTNFIFSLSPSNYSHLLGDKHYERQHYLVDESSYSKEANHVQYTIMISMHTRNTLTRAHVHAHLMACLAHRMNVE
jgi:hypothetical protein